MYLIICVCSNSINVHCPITAENSEFEIFVKPNFERIKKSGKCKINNNFKYIAWEEEDTMNRLAELLTYLDEKGYELVSTNTSTNSYDKVTQRYFLKKCRGHINKFV